MKKRLLAVLCTMIMLMNVITPGALADDGYKMGAELYKEGSASGSLTVYKKPRTYRIDRMKAVSLTREPRTGEEHFKDVDICTYAQRVFGMYGGAKQAMTINIRISCMKTLKNLLKSTPVAT